MADYAVDVSAHPSDWLRIAPPDYRTAKWTSTDLPIGGDYHGALAIAGPCSDVQVLRLHLDEAA